MLKNIVLTYLKIAHFQIQVATYQLCLIYMQHNTVSLMSQYTINVQTCMDTINAQQQGSNQLRHDIYNGNSSKKQLFMQWKNN